MMKKIFALVSVGFMMGAASLVAPAAEHAYVGSKKCKICHLPQHKSWELTKMANAFSVLKPGERAAEKTKAGLDPAKDYTTDAKCLPCHVTGYGKAGGFTSLKETPDLAGVGCEMCHGSGADYLKTGLMTATNKEYKRADVVAAGLVIPNAQTCAELCHNSKSPFVKKDYVFDWAKRKDEGTHQHQPLKYKHD